VNDSPNAVHLSNHHRDTLDSIFQHPSGHNIEWKAVLSLLNVVGDVDETKEGRFRVIIGGEEQVFTRPRHKDIDVQTIVDLRRMLSKAGFTNSAPPVTEGPGK